MKQRMTVVSCLKVFEQINVPDVAGTAINTTKLKETRAHTYFMSAGPGGGRGILLFHQQHQTLEIARVFTATRPPYTEAYTT